MYGLGWGKCGGASVDGCLSALRAGMPADLCG